MGSPGGFVYVTETHSHDGRSGFVFAFSIFGRAQNPELRTLLFDDAAARRRRTHHAAFHAVGASEFVAFTAPGHFPEQRGGRKIQNSFTFLHLMGLFWYVSP
jgi:hypothetical protein